MAANASATAMAASSGLLLNTPTWRSDARSVRTANAASAVPRSAGPKGPCGRDIRP